MQPGLLLQGGEEIGFDRDGADHLTGAIPHLGVVKVREVVRVPELPHLLQAYLPGEILLTLFASIGSPFFGDFYPRALIMMVIAVSGLYTKNTAT